MKQRKTHGLKRFSHFEVIADPSGVYVLVELTRGQWCEVDIDDWFGGLDRIKWRAVWNRATRSYYAYGRLEGEGKNALMHRMILGAANPTIKVDHKNHDTLCNRRFNLRLCNSSQNICNSRKRGNNKSGFIGVSWDKRRRLWRATAKKHGRQVRLGHFENPIEAAKIRDEAAKVLYGQFAYLNFPDEAKA